MITLVVGRTWDGELLPPEARSNVRIGYDGDELVVQVDAPYAGDPAPTGAPGPTDKLWEHEVVELFVVGADQRYTEIELSPHGHHLGIRLEGIRNRVVVGFPIRFEPPVIHEGRWSGTARIDRSLLPDPALTCNAYRVSGTAPHRRYEAMAAVPGDRPDFHRLERFAPWML
jgi:hypothetical protein